VGIVADGELNHLLGVESAGRRGIDVAHDVIDGDLVLGLGSPYLPLFGVAALR
jgi:hypothetical protein